MTDNTDGQIVVASSPLWQQLEGLARAGLFTLGGYLTAKGWLSDGIVQALVPVIITAAPLAWQQWRIRRSQAVKVALANRLPDAVATTK